MSSLRFIAREAAVELRFALKTSVVPLIFIGLTAYILLFLTSAGYLQDMGAGDVQRNAPSLVYLFSTGDTFFLFFAWAWLYAQPIVRDRAAQLHEIVLTAPVSLRALLFGRFLGAFAVAMLLGASQSIGFVLAPLLETAGLVPPGSMGPTPWAALGWSWLIFIVPIAFGAGALYFSASLITRNVTGPFAAAAILILAWMFAIVMVDEGGRNPMLATIIDPSSFTDANRTVMNWTPLEKASALYPLTTPFLLNRLLWVGAPLLVLAVCLWRTTRESLALEREPKRSEQSARAATVRRPEVRGDAESSALVRSNWAAAVVAEIRWQVARVTHNRGFWIGMGAMVLLGFVAVFYHMLGHAEGPFVPGPENTPPVLTKVLFLVIAFVVAALAGNVMRRDDRAGFGEMMDAAPAPIYVRVIGRCAAVALVVLVLALTPAVSSSLAVALMAPQAFELATPFLYQLLTLAPAMFELAAIALLAHSLIRPSGPAYAASMLATFMVVLNNEVQIVTYPPFKVGVNPEIALSALTGWGEWTQRLLIEDGFKLCVALLLVAIAGIVLTRGVDSRRVTLGRHLRERLFGPLGAAVALTSLAGAALLSIMDTRYIEQGGYHSREQELADDSAWEQRWLREVGSFSVAGGSADFSVDPIAARVNATWQLHAVKSAVGSLHAELPHGFRLLGVRVNGASIEAEIFEDHLSIPLGACHTTGCEVELSWAIDVHGWDTDGEAHWLSLRGIWLTAERVLPSLGFDVDRMLRVPSERERLGLARLPTSPPRESRNALLGVAPAGDWSWKIRVQGMETINGQTTGPLRFAAVWSQRATASTLEGMSFVHQRNLEQTAQTIAEDVVQMRECVTRRLGTAPEVTKVVQLPHGIGSSHCAFGQSCGFDQSSEMIADQLLLAEEPHWHIAGTGMGRWLRQQRIASLLAEQVVADAANLRQGDGAQWLSSGLSGAIGLLCVGDASGLTALQALLTRGAKETTQALAASQSPVHTVSDAPGTGWISEYAPLSSLSWVATAQPDSLRDMLRIARETGDIQHALQSIAGPQVAAALLGAPRLSDVALGNLPGSDPEVLRWQWRAGGWQPVPSETRLLRVHAQSDASGAHLVASRDDARTPANEAIVMDDWESYERAPVDNWIVAQP